MDAVAWAKAIRAQQVEADRQCWREALRLTSLWRDRGAERVILFGSAARHRASPGSDLDLAVVMPGVDDVPVASRALEVLAVARPSVPVDLLVYSPAEWQRVQGRGFVRREICERGVTLYERG